MPYKHYIFLIVICVFTFQVKSAGFANSNTTELVKANEAIQLKATANPTQGDGSLVISITYVVIAY